SAHTPMLLRVATMSDLPIGRPARSSDLEWWFHPRNGWNAHRRQHLWSTQIHGKRQTLGTFGAFILKEAFVLATPAIRLCPAGATARHCEWYRCRPLARRISHDEDD